MPGLGGERGDLQEHVEEFDLILMLHVLEHVTKDETIAFLQAVRGALKPHGKLVVEVPNTIIRLWV